MKVAAFFARSGEFLLFAARAVAGLAWPPLRLSATVREVYVQGVRALGLATVASLFTGMALALQFGSGLGRFGADSLLPQITSLGLFRELTPVMIGLVIGARIGAGIAAELGTMAVTEQLDALRVLGADPTRELVSPRVAAAALVLPLVSAWADALGLAGALLIAALQHGIHPRYFLHAVADFLLPGDLLIGLGKAAGFGAAVATIACWHGGRATGGADGVGRATTQTVVQGALTVIVADYFLGKIAAPLLAGGPGF